MTMITTASGRTRELPPNLDAARVAGLDEEGRIVVDPFDARNAPDSPVLGPPHMFGLTLCCNASDEATEHGLVCKACYGMEAGHYMLRGSDGTFLGLDPIVPAPSAPGTEG